MLDKQKFRRALNKSNIYLRHPAKTARWGIDIIVGRILGGILSKNREGNIASFHIGRCGSTVLGGMLRQHIKIFWDGETLTRFYRYKKMKRIPLAAMEGIHKRIILYRMNITGKKYYGFETRFFQIKEFKLTLPEYIEQLEAFGFDHFIILERRNYLKVALSWAIAHEKFKYHQPLAKKSKLDAITLNINGLCMDGECKPLISYLDEWDNYYKQAESLLAKKKMIKIIYEEDILNDPIRGYEKICAFLGLSPENIAIQHGRTNPFNIKEVLLNYNEVAKELAGTRFEWMLE